MKRFIINKEVVSEDVDYYEYSFDEDSLQYINDKLKMCCEQGMVSIPFRELTLEDCYNIVHHDADDWLLEDMLLTYYNPLTNEKFCEYKRTIASVVYDWIIDEVYRDPDSHNHEGFEVYDRTTEIRVVD